MKMQWILMSVVIVGLVFLSGCNEPAPNGNGNSSDSAGGVIARVWASPDTVAVGDSVTIHCIAKNEGTVAGNFSIGIWSNQYSWSYSEWRTVDPGDTMFYDVTLDDIAVGFECSASMFIEGIAQAQDEKWATITVEA